MLTLLKPKKIVSAPKKTFVLRETLQAQLCCINLTAPDILLLALQKIAQKPYLTRDLAVTPCRLGFSDPKNTEDQFTRDMIVLRKFFFNLTSETRVDSYGQKKVLSRPKVETTLNIVEPGKSQNYSAMLHTDPFDSLIVIQQDEGDDILTWGLKDGQQHITVPSMRLPSSDSFRFDYEKDAHVFDWLYQQHEKTTSALKEEAKTKGVFWQAMPCEVSVMVGNQTWHAGSIMPITAPARERRFRRCDLSPKYYNPRHRGNDDIC